MRKSCEFRGRRKEEMIKKKDDKVKRKNVKQVADDKKEKDDY